MPRAATILKELRERGRHRVECCGLSVEVFPNVFYCYDSELMARSIDVPEGASVLDMGTGTGILAIIAAKNAKHVLASDISDEALACANHNIKASGLQEKITVRRSNLFRNIPWKFDVIIFNIPFNNSREPTDTLERTVFDKDAKLLIRFLSKVRQHLNPGGKSIISSSSFSMYDVLDTHARKTGLVPKRIAEKKMHGDVFYVYELTFKAGNLWT
jgi:release factor glutamine methyltransferase